jgi:CRP/FNR family transcriptional regulator, cyclic AMP receptor protein
MSSPINIEKYVKEKQDFTQGQVIFEEGETGKYLYLVKQGEVEIIKNGQVIDLVKAGGIFGEMALIDMSSRSATARARSDCQLILMDEYNFLFLVQHAPYFSLQVMKTMAERLRLLMAHTQG